MKLFKNNLRSDLLLTILWLPLIILIYIKLPQSFNINYTKRLQFELSLIKANENQHNALTSEFRIVVDLLENNETQKAVNYIGDKLFEDAVEIYNWVGADYQKINSDPVLNPLFESFINSVLHENETKNFALIIDSVYLDQFLNKTKILFQKKHSKFDINVIDFHTMRQPSLIMKVIYLKIRFYAFLLICDGKLNTARDYMNLQIFNPETDSVISLSSPRAE